MRRKFEHATMHEYSLAEDLIQTITGRLAIEKIDWPGAVSGITLRVGALEIHSVESFRQALELQCGNSPLDRVKWKIEVVPGWFKCEKCGREQQTGIGDTDAHASLPVVECPVCGSVCIVNGGRGIEPMDIAIEQP